MALMTKSATGVHVLHDTRSTAEILGVAVITLYKWRAAGKGPKFVRVGRHIGYLADDINAFLMEQRRASSSDRGPPSPSKPARATAELRTHP
jgi:predicted DNA-binding transcriptional regulator AlpA